MRLLAFLPMLITCTGLAAQSDTGINKTPLDEVVVTGQYNAQTLRNSVYNVRTISRELIQKRGATNIQGILSTEIDFRFTTDYTLGESDIKIMGIGGTSVKILLNGIPLSDRDQTKQSLSQIDINTVERIEIVEGPMSVLYGTDALAGVINIITKKAVKDQLNIATRVQEESAGSHYTPFRKDGIHNESVLVGYGIGKWIVNGSVTRNDFGGLTDTAPYPAKVWKPKKQWLAGAGLTYQASAFSVGYRLDYADENIYIAGPVNINNGIAQDQYYLTKRYTHQLQSNWRISSRLSMNNAASYQDYQRNTETYRINYIQQSKTRQDGSGFWDVTNFSTWFYRSTLQWYVSSMVSIQPGVEIKSDKTTGQRVNGEPSITDYAVFATAEIKPFKRINIRPGIRFSKNSVYDAPPVIPSINTLFNLSKNLDLRISYARGYRAPILRELYFYYHDANHDIDGNPNLEAEHSNSFNTSFTWQKKLKSVQLTTTVTGFYNDFKNKISLAIAPGTTVYTYINIDRAKNTGGTLQQTVSWKNLSASAGFSYIGYYNVYSDAKDVTTGDHSTFAFAPEVNSSVMYSFNKLKASVSVFYKFYGAIPAYQLEGSEVVLAKTASYHMADLTATKTIFSFLELQAGIKNIFDVTRVNNSASGGGAHSTSGPTIISYGRSWFAGISFQLNKANNKIK